VLTFVLCFVQSPLSALGIRFGRRQTMPILKGCTGILHPVPTAVASDVMLTRLIGRKWYFSAELLAHMCRAA
jgi:hypothetical protein